MINEECYLDCLINIDIAQNTINNLKLFSEKNPICDLYAIPSHNFQSYYVVVYEKKGSLEAVYAKPQIISPKFGRIDMCTFVDVIKAEEKFDYKGRIIVGIVSLDKEMIQLITDIIENIPDKFMLGNQGLYIDGVIQGIRVYSDSKIIKEVLYRDSKDIKLPMKKMYLQAELEELYIKIGELIKK